nr:hypothetical protein [Tanacetum cinerariifolium]
MIMDVNFYEKRNESVYYSVLRDLHRLQVIPQNLHHLIAIPQEVQHHKTMSGTSISVGCSNCKHLLGKIKVLEAAIEMHMHPETTHIPAGLVQQARLLKEKVFILDPDGALMSRQQYMDKVVEDVGDDNDFKSAACVSTIPGTIHHKFIGKGGYGKDIIVGAAMMLTNVSVFSPNPSKHYLNITMRNVVEVFLKDTVLWNGSG